MAFCLMWTNAFLRPEKSRGASAEEESHAVAAWQLTKMLTCKNIDRLQLNTTTAHQNYNCWTSKLSVEKLP